MSPHLGPRGASNSPKRLPRRPHGEADGPTKPPRLIWRRIWTYFLLILDPNSIQKKKARDIVTALSKRFSALEFFLLLLLLLQLLLLILLLLLLRLLLLPLLHRLCLLLPLLLLLLSLLLLRLILLLLLLLLFPLLIPSPFWYPWLVVPLAGRT